MNGIHCVAEHGIYLLPLRAGGGREGVTLSAFQALHPNPTLLCCTQGRELGHTGGIS